MPDFDRLAANDNPVGVDGGRDPAFGQRNRFAPAANDLVQHLAGLREHQAILLIKGQHPRPKTLQRSRNVDNLVLQLFQCILICFDAGAAGASQPRQEFRHLVGRIAGRRPEKRQVKLIAEQILAHHALAVLVVERGGKRRREGPVRIAVIASADEVRPQGKPFIGDISVERIQITMEGIQIENVRGFERNSFELDRDHQRPGVEGDCGLVHVPDVRNEGLGTNLARPEGGEARQIRGPFRRSGAKDAEAISMTHPSIRWSGTSHVSPPRRAECGTCCDRA